MQNITVIAAFSNYEVGK